MKILFRALMITFFINVGCADTTNTNVVDAEKETLQLDISEEDFVDNMESIIAVFNAFHDLNMTITLNPENTFNRTDVSSDYNYDFHPRPLDMILAGSMNTDSIGNYSVNLQKITYLAHNNFNIKEAYYQASCSTQIGGKYSDKLSSAFEVSYKQNSDDLMDIHLITDQFNILFSKNYNTGIAIFETDIKYSLSAKDDSYSSTITVSTEVTDSSLMRHPLYSQQVGFSSKLDAKIFYKGEYIGDLVPLKRYSNWQYVFIDKFGNDGFGTSEYGGSIGIGSTITRGGSYL